VAFLHSNEERVEEINFGNKLKAHGEKLKKLVHAFTLTF
jgi:hypothetical protein